ncbi:MAG: YraN family protein [Thermoleophilaceae bacterium]|nr:YraN family protein [Thermoleophilaceae bacterium]
MARGWVIVGRNVRCGRGELDLIACDGRTLVVGEVKTLAAKRAGGFSPFESIGVQKQRQIRRLASAWLSGDDAVDGAGDVVVAPRGTSELRFDAFAVVVETRTGAFEITHLEGAF